MSARDQRVHSLTKFGRPDPDIIHKSFRGNREIVCKETTVHTIIYYSADIASSLGIRFWFILNNRHMWQISLGISPPSTGRLQSLRSHFVKEHKPDREGNIKLVMGSKLLHIILVGKHKSHDVDDSGPLL